MRRTSIICPACKELVEVTDKVLAEHGECPASGMHYSPQRFKLGAGGPTIDVLASKPFSETCPGCGEEHSGMALLFKVSSPDPTVN